MSHLHPCNVQVDIGGVAIDIHVTFGWHVFTDEKQRGVPFLWHGQTRYFCRQRYNTSFAVRDFVQTKLIDTYARPFIDYYRNEQYFCIEGADLAIFMTVRKPENTDGRLKLNVVSAYEVDQWGRTTLPKGKAYKMRYVLDRRHQGHTMLGK